MARLHGLSFAQEWEVSDFETFLADPCCVSLVAQSPEEADVLGFVTVRAAGSEADIVTLAVTPQARRRGVGRALVAGLVESLAGRGVAALFLEVGADNHAALALYRRAGFAEAGRRRDYYPQRGAAAARDALVLRLDLSVR